jgi:hypothetical protein
MLMPHPIPDTVTAGDMLIALAIALVVVAFLLWKIVR